MFFIRVYFGIGILCLKGCKYRYHYKSRDYSHRCNKDKYKVLYEYSKYTRKLNYV